ncbi:GH25006 [Drosophila grimshawi]|uniref:GH25006 n=1 Tax=Drosophila grimshawi TaxID=7222 RepID=B4K2X1_DROGR|nr:GH25006 [Drosophila grimshawi]
MTQWAISPSEDLADDEESGPIHQATFTVSAGASPEVDISAHQYRVGSEFLTRDCVPILVYIKGIVSAYFAKDAPCTPPEVENLVEYCRKEKMPIRIGCDANAYHTIWGSKTSI